MSMPYSQFRIFFAIVRRNLSPFLVLTRPSERPPMATNISNTMTPPNLFASIDMGTNSFKLLLIQADPNGRFLTINRHKEPVLLGRGMLSTSPPSITPESQSRAITTLQKFSQILHNQPINQTKIVATSAVREAVNQHEFLSRIEKDSNFQVQILSGEEEARLVYIGVLQFLPVFQKTVLTIDIGGGSTEFVVGKEGKVIFATSLKLGHVILTEKFGNGDENIVKMREYIRSVVYESGLVEKVKDIGIEVVVGSSGTIRAIEKAVYMGYGTSTVISHGGLGRSWKFSREELGFVVEKLCGLEPGGEEEMGRNGFFKRRSEFICAGAVLLSEIFEILNIDEMEVSEYALGEGVIVESLASCYEGYDVGANARWRSVVGLATRFHSDKRMKSATRCLGIARELFAGLKKWEELANHEKMGEKDLEYLEAACLLHNIGQFIGKKGYHKQSYHIIKNGDYLHGYNPDEVEMIALLVRRHRKKFPSSDHSSLDRFSKEVKEELRNLWAIIRVSVALQQCSCMDFQKLAMSSSQEIELAFCEKEEPTLASGHLKSTVENVKVELRKELQNFEKVFQKKLSVVVSSSS